MGEILEQAGHGQALKARIGADDQLRRSRRGLDRSEPEEDLPAEEFVSKEVDPILDKITAHGIQSLTERERRILEKARSKIGKR